jgi:predicted methyltransferase
VTQVGSPAHASPGLFVATGRPRPLGMNNSSTRRPMMFRAITPNLALAVVVGVVSLNVGCGPSAPAAVAPAESPTPTTSSATAEPASTPSAPEPVAPTPEELARQAAQEQLARDFAKLDEEHTRELARLTPELRAAVTTLVDKSPVAFRPALTAALKGPQRRPGHAERDSQRHPLETLEFLGLQTNQKVLEYGPGEGWYTELLAPVLAKRGQLFVTLTNPDGSREERSTLYGRRTQLALDSLPEAYGKVERVVVSPPTIALGVADNTLDTVLLFRGLHGMFNSGTLDNWLAEFNRTLKPKGVLGIEQHRAAADADPVVSSKKGYLPEAFVIEHVEKAGFKLVKKSEINANPKDTKDYADGVWALPPTLRGGETDKGKYVTIGETDRMTLKFVKAAATPAKNPASGGTTVPPAATP